MPLSRQTVGNCLSSLSWEKFFEIFGAPTKWRDVRTLGWDMIGPPATYSSVSNTRPVLKQRTGGIFQKSDKGPAWNKYPGI